MNSNGIRLACRSAYVTVVSFPMTIVALLLQLVRAPLARRLVRWLHVSWIGASVPATPPRAGWWIRALLLSMVSSAVSGYVMLGVVLNLAYPLRGQNAEVTDWGGPTLAGRWSVHAAGGVLFVVLALWLMPALRSLAHRWLAETRRRDPRAG